MSKEQNTRIIEFQSVARGVRRFKWKEALSIDQISMLDKAQRSGVLNTALVISQTAISSCTLALFAQTQHAAHRPWIIYDTGESVRLFAGVRVDIRICGSGYLATQGCGQFVIKAAAWLYKRFWSEEWWWAQKQDHGVTRCKIWRIESASEREVVKYMHVCRCLASFCVFVYTHAGTLYSTLQACRWELCQGGTEVVGRKYTHTQLCHSAGETQTSSSPQIYIYSHSVE